MGKGLATAAVGLVCVFLMLRWLERHLIYVPSRQLEASGAALNRSFEDVFLTTGDGVGLNGWFFPATAGSRRAHVVILLLHGNGGNISHRLDYYVLWLELGVSVFALDYRGYGRSEGVPTEAGTYLDAEAARVWLTGKGFAPPHIIALGESLGGGVASELAVKGGVGGLVLQSSFTRIRDLGAELYPWLLPVRWLARTHYDTLERLPRLQCPVLILHSRDDTLIRFRHAERNFAAAREPKMLWEIRGDHNTTLDADPAAYRQGLEQFLVRHFDVPAP
ncbi:MAG: alpha/beta hydrolase [Verrucomicrobia bacterium]|nr:alpha/beta hydrolase [Verrucomicrobiota bacterium]